MGSSSSTGENSVVGPGGVQQGGTLSYNSVPMNYQNPAGFDPDKLNPSASGYLDNLNGLYSEFSNSAAGGAFNPAFYNQLEQTQQNALTTSLMNSYAGMGLAGSSAEMGGLNQAIQSNQMNWMNRQQGDQLKALGGLEGLNHMGYGMTMGIQNQYGDFESAYNQSIANMLGMGQQQQIANQQMIASIIGAGLQGAGMAAGGMGHSGGGGGGGYGGGGGENFAGADYTMDGSGADWSTYGDPNGP